MTSFSLAHNPRDGRGQARVSRGLSGLGGNGRHLRSLARDIIKAQTREPLHLRPCILAVDGRPERPRTQLVPVE